MPLRKPLLIIGSTATTSAGGRGRCSRSAATWHSPTPPSADLPRDLITWHDNNHVRWAAFGTDSKLYAYRFDLQTLYDITPAGVGPLDPPGALVGYGLADYGESTYGTARDPGGYRPAGHQCDDGRPLVARYVRRGSARRPDAGRAPVPLDAVDADRAAGDRGRGASAKPWRYRHRPSATSCCMARVAIRA